MDSSRVQIVIEQDEDGMYIAECPALQGCYSQGETFEEALENVKEVIGMCLQELREDGKAKYDSNIEYEILTETDLILSDDELVKQIRQGELDRAAGKAIPWEIVKCDLNL